MRTRVTRGVGLGALALLCLSLAGFVVAGGAAAPPGIEQIVGQYAVTSKYVSKPLDEPKAETGSAKSTFIITRTGPEQVQLVWQVGAEQWTYSGIYRNGVLTIGVGDAVNAPPQWIEVMVLAFSGSPGKISVAGKYLWHEWWPAWKFFDTETIKGKMVAI